MPTALITGITGMVGSHLLDFLIENTDWKIFGITRWRSPASNIEHHFNTDYFNSRITYLEADLLDYQSLLNAVTTAKPDYVFHLAAQSFPTTSFNIPIQTLDINILGTARLLEAIKFSGLDPWIHVGSSSEIFGRVKSIDLPIKENTRFQPASPYSISKIGTDLLSVYYSQAYNLKTRFGLTTEQFSAMIVEQNNRCKICGCDMVEPQVDHNHTTGKVRSLLCRPCNTSLGMLKENTETLYNMISYINNDNL